MVLLFQRCCKGRAEAHGCKPAADRVHRRVEAGPTKEVDGLAGVGVVGLNEEVVVQKLFNGTDVKLLPGGLCTRCHGGGAAARIATTTADNADADATRDGWGLLLLLVRQRRRRRRRRGAVFLVPVQVPSEAGVAQDSGASGHVQRMRDANQAQQALGARGLGGEHVLELQAFPFALAQALHAHRHKLRRKDDGRIRQRRRHKLAAAG